MRRLQLSARRALQASQVPPSLSFPARGEPCFLCRRAIISSHRQSISRLQRHYTTGAASATPHASTEPPKPRNFYELFPQTLSAGPPPQGPFNIDPRELRKEFLQLQAKAHPDRHPSEAKTQAEATSAWINEAYKTLLNPLQRAQYLLSLRGLDVTSDEKAELDDPELLIQVMDASEELEAAENESQLRPLKETVEERLRESLEVLDAAFRADDLKRARKHAVKLKYWTTLKESLDSWEMGKPVVLSHWS